MPYVLAFQVARPQAAKLALVKKRSDNPNRHFVKLIPMDDQGTPFKLQRLLKLTKINFYTVIGVVSTVLVVPLIVLFLSPGHVAKLCALAATTRMA